MWSEGCSTLKIGQMRARVLYTMVERVWNGYTRKGWLNAGPQHPIILTQASRDRQLNCVVGFSPLKPFAVHVRDLPTNVRFKGTFEYGCPV